jgi:ABC-type polar amino acid transport system ATPase subunit
VLGGVDLTLHKGEVVVIFGRSGSGKSTLLRCVNFLEDPTRGRSRWQGVRLSEGTGPPQRGADPPARLHVGMVFQQFNLFPQMTALENLMVAPLCTRKADEGSVRKRALELLDRVGLADKADEHPIRCPAASSSGSRSPGRSRWTRRSCSSTSRPPLWTRS